MAHSHADRMIVVRHVIEKSKVQANAPTPKGILKRGVNKLIALAREKDPPRKIALGLALGIFIGILPIMGIQMAVVTIIALPLRGNLKAAIAGVWISNPVTFLPMYWGYYRFGLLFTPARQMTWQKFRTLIEEAANWSWTDLLSSLKRVIDLGEDILIPMWIGATILAIVCAIPTYFTTYRFVVMYRSRKESTKSQSA